MTTPFSFSRVLLVPDRRSLPESEHAPVRRYRIARLRFDGASADAVSRYEHLKRVYE